MTCIVEINIQQRTHVIFLLGSGLIGEAIAKELTKRFDFSLFPITISWDGEASQSFQHIYKKLSKVIGAIERNNKLPTVHVIWAAGSSGFSSNEKETEKELYNFSECLDVTSKLAVNELGASVHFHLISSAGGLFEGQRLVSPYSTPNPIRPYGHLKLAQENLLASYRKDVTAHIYRLTSAYGFIRSGQRRGLISALIENARYGQITIISGSMYTLRDFVWAPDVSRFIVRAIELEKLVDRPVILASGKPETVENVKRYIESSLNRKVYSRYLYTPTNDASTCVSSTVLPDDWVPSYMKSNIDRVISVYRSFDIPRI